MTRAGGAFFLFFFCFRDLFYLFIFLLSESTDLSEKTEIFSRQDHIRGASCFDKFSRTSFAIVETAQLNFLLSKNVSLVVHNDLLS